jgi:hypothetical protein
MPVCYTTSFKNNRKQMIGDSKATFKNVPTRKLSFGFGRTKKVDTTPAVKIGPPVPVLVPVPPVHYIL